LGLFRRGTVISFTTAGESHGKGLVAVLEGIPAGLPLVADDVDRELRRRMAGHGRGARMKIEADAVEILSGVRAGETIGSPIAMLIRNLDWDNWAEIMAPEPDGAGAGPRRRRLTRPRPGHADLVGGDPVQQLAEMLEARARFYERADHVVATDSRSVAEVARDVLALARSRAGW